MTERNPPSWTQNGAHPAEHDRLLTESLIQAEGIITAGALAVSERAAGANMSVDVAAGHAWVEGDETAHQAIYHVYNDAVVNLTIAASDPSNPRIDLVVARVYDQFYSGSVDEFALEVVTGTPATSPSEPAVPDNSLVLARVDVAAGTSSITDADITDRRPRTYPRGGGHVATVVFTADGTFDKADYPWLSRVRVRLVGGGGAGGGSELTGSGQVSTGAGGAGAGYAEGVIDVDDLAASETVTVGSGGAGNSAGSGNTGGASSFGSHVAANGGSGGNKSSTSAATGADGSLGGIGTAGDTLVRGQGGGSSHAHASPLIGQTGHGGSSQLGGGAPGEAFASAPADGRAGGQYGGGGGGSGAGPSTAARAGGAGADGVVIVDLYA